MLHACTAEFDVLRNLEKFLAPCLVHPKTQNFFKIPPVTLNFAAHAWNIKYK